MARRSTTTTAVVPPIAFLLLVILVLLVFATDGAWAFGAGNIPGFAYLEGKAFRHGDIEDILAELQKKGGAGFLGSITGSKFGGLDIKRVYFGNYYSQAMDVAGLQKLSRQTIINLCMALGFLAHGYATSEFEVTEERLGVYLPVEHIDNPKGYNEGKDAREVHPSLRPPVEQVELEIDPQSGMKNYIANERGHWDTSSALLRRVFGKCIEVGRRARQNNNVDDEYEAFRLLGTGLHTLEDFSAHSNFCELALLKLGYRQVFCHVGDAVKVRTRNGEMVPPLVTGSFGGADFIHSLLGEATDHISEASVSDLNKAMDDARAKGPSPLDVIRKLVFQLPGTGGSAGDQINRDMSDVEGIRSRASQPGFDPSQLSPQELHATMWKILKFRDDICKRIEGVIEKIPGLGSLIETLTENINRFVFTTLEPYLKPVMQAATGGLSQGSAAVINSHDQFEVFNDRHASDPTHSFLSKDHFNLILNEPAGNLAKIVVRHAVRGIVAAWGDTSVDANQVINTILETFHHPFFSDGRSNIQRDMIEHMRSWIENDQDKQYVLNGLTKESVKANRNRRKGHQEEGHGANGRYQSFLPTPAQLLDQATTGLGQVTGLPLGGGRTRREVSESGRDSFGGRNDDYGVYQAPAQLSHGGGYGNFGESTQRSESQQYGGGRSTGSGYEGGGYQQSYSAPSYPPQEQSSGFPVAQNNYPDPSRGQGYGGDNEGNGYPAHQQPARQQQFGMPEPDYQGNSGGEYYQPPRQPSNEGNQDGW